MQPGIRSLDAVVQKSTEEETAGKGQKERKLRADMSLTQPSGTS